MTGKPDILVFMSDQHNPRVSGHMGDRLISTPNLDRLAAEGATFHNAYTSCPLCVPARMSMLTGQLPSRNGILTNSGILSSEHATVAHCLAAGGYDTVLCGRMHFLGPDQRHGFTQRPIGDFTPCYLGRYGNSRLDLGPYINTSAGSFAKLYGGGTSPVLEYDRAVIAAALDCLAKPHEKPLFLLVGTYGPHHTFVAPEPLYRKYKDRMAAPVSERALHPVTQMKTKSLEPEIARCLRAAYYGMVEQIDTQLGEVRAAWMEYLNRVGREGIFVYTSDHGEHLGEDGLWGKQTFYEASCRIPLMAAGCGAQPGVRVMTPCSLVDLSPTLCELAGVSAPPEQDGVSLAKALGGEPLAADRVVVSEVLATHRATGRHIPGRMARQGKWKYVTYAGYERDDQLFEMESDPRECRNCIAEQPTVAQALRRLLTEDWDPEHLIADQKRRAQHWAILGKWGKGTEVPEPDRWPIPRSAWQLPTP